TSYPNFNIQPVMKIIKAYSTFNLSLILFVTLLVTIFPSSKAKKTTRFKCGDVTKAINAEKLIDYDALKTCFKSIPFNATNAAQIIDSASHILSSYYVFLDQANKNPPNGFTYQPINIIGELKSLRKKKFKPDYDFKTALRTLIFKLKDGHTRFESLCYQNFNYEQNLSLYSVITTDKKKRQKQVFKDSVNPSNNDCEVTEIEGKPALQLIIEFANNSIAQSKDLGVRFNMALAPSNGLFASQFTSRIDLPENSIITYKLLCPQKKPFLLKRKWSITFDGGVEFFDNVCLNLNSEATLPNNNVASSRNKDEMSTSSDKVTKLISRKVSKLNNKQKIAHAKLIYEGYDAAFYTLDDENVGVAVITGEKENDESSLQEGFEKLRKVKKLILDFSNNDGGDITVPLIKKNFKKRNPESDSLYDPNLYLVFPSGDRFSSPDQFIGSRKTHTSNLYLNALTSDELKRIKDTPRFPWKSDDIIILTNGYCASACALITLFFSEIHKVETIAVGGLLDNKLSFSTFPGGQLTSSNIIINDAGDHAADVSFPNLLLLAVRKSVSFFKNNTEKEVLEYSYRPADHRFYYNEANAKDPSILWAEAAKILSKKS
ncbi:6262_t:CDS:2, partial [Racocetra persica]